MKLLTNKPRSYVVLFTLFFLTAVTAPFWLWQLEPSKQLDVAIIDKTVPDESYREHNGLVWILNNEKYKNDDSERYSANSDYSGFKPEKENEYSVLPLPENLARQDLIYLADQYGVYKQEFLGKNEMGKRSEMLYGGLQPEEMDVIEEALFTGKEKTFIAEFNTFGSPASNEVRSRISNLLNAEWTGWIGRYFPDLAGKEVPIWAKENYEKQTGKWNFKNGGFVFVDRNDFIVVVPQNELTDNGARFKFTEEGRKKFGDELEADYQYWFDIIEARDESEILATYSLPLKKEAKNRLAGYGIPAQFPAVLNHENARFSSYYFAGDFADEGEVPSLYQTRGIAEWRQFFAARDSFYWKAYVPMMKKLLEQGLHSGGEQKQVEIIEKAGVKINSKTGDKYIQILQGGKWEDVLIKGVNMGMGKPGSYPGEAAISKDEYTRWFRAIGEMNANVLRIYTLHPPAFYKAFLEYNMTAEKPLYLLHGAWVNEEELIKNQDAFLSSDDIKTEITYMVDMIHGNAKVPERKGHASGTYSADITEYVLGFIAGIEWDPQMVVSTNEKHKNMKQFNGTYFKTNNASPFEIWLAEIMDYAVAYETEKYGWQHSMSFTNWVTTDLLKHPAEPDAQEDLVSVNPNHIVKQDAFKAGMFASYHIYPYYPDFLNLEERYLNYTDKDGNKNNYAGYLNDLVKEHTMPVVVAEFGVPGSRGLTHKNPLGMDQGNHSEQEQGKINSVLFKSIVDEGYAGGMVFAWQDEWFKRTWNTMHLEDENRRPYWNNQQTNEQHFGLLGFDPGARGAAIYTDGNDADWEKAGIESAYKDDQGPISSAYFTSDEGYFHFLINMREPQDLKTNPVHLLLDTVPDQGQATIGGSFKPGIGVDFKIDLAGENDSRIMVDSYYDPFYYLYGEKLGMIRKKPYASKKDNGIFHPIMLALNKKMTHPITKEILKFTDYEAGKLSYGNANPASKEFNSLTDISISADKKTLEGRIPWQLLNMRDPSQREAMADIWKIGMDKSIKLDGMNIAIAQSEGNNMKAVFPETGLPYSFTWKEWEKPRYHERLKESYYILRDAYRKIGIEGEK
ncbi:hypothetical protein [Bacillus sp. EB01]|uniref:hypothetical protein n=1 Tax=Bacillus sp. EB01 TaxID=1347086 RepID=UPI0005C53CB3|nr:hypothetical protein [Bacillus sp. EB01]